MSAVTDELRQIAAAFARHPDDKHTGAQVAEFLMCWQPKDQRVRESSTGSWLDAEIDGPRPEAS